MYYTPRICLPCVKIFELLKKLPDKKFFMNVKTYTYKYM